MFQLTLSPELTSRFPAYRVAAVYAEVTNTPFSEGLWQEIDAFTQALRASETPDTIKLQPAIALRASETPDTIKLQPAIAATREAYRRLGKDPSRYRPSAEALRRRLLRGLELYRIDTLVDLINLVSLRTGYSIGGFDADKIQGTDLCLGVGHANEPFEGIGRGPLNIEGLPVWRDAQGGIGTPTSDHERTKMDVGTRHILALINGYDGDEERLREAAEMTRELLRRYAASDGGTITYLHSEEE